MDLNGKRTTINIPTAIQTYGAVRVRIIRVREGR